MPIVLNLLATKFFFVALPSSFHPQPASFRNRPRPRARPRPRSLIPRWFKESMAPRLSAPRLPRALLFRVKSVEHENERLSNYGEAAPLDFGWCFSPKRTGASGEIGLTGRRRVNIVPLPGSLVMSMVPI